MLSFQPAPQARKAAANALADEVLGALQVCRDLCVLVVFDDPSHDCGADLWREVLERFTKLALPGAVAASIRAIPASVTINGSKFMRRRAASSIRPRRKLSSKTLRAMP